MDDKVTGEEYVNRTVEASVVGAVLRAAPPTRRRMLAALGTATLAALIDQVFPLRTLKALAADPVGKPEKTDVTIGFIPITCGTPIIWPNRWGSTRSTDSTPP